MKQNKDKLIQWVKEVFTQIGQTDPDVIRITQRLQEERFPKPVDKQEDKIDENNGRVK